MRSLFPFVLLAAGAALAGCAAVDAQVSALTDRHCASSRLISGKSYCAAPEAVGQSKLYCFKTLGDVDCYRAADPYGIGQTGRALVNPITEPGAG